jgi:hypothetical protein
MLQSSPKVAFSSEIDHYKFTIFAGGFAFWLVNKTTTVQFVNSCGFKKQQFWFKDVTVVEKEEQF